MPKITFLPTGKTYEVALGKRYYDFCQEEKVPHPFGCTVASCGTCCSVVTVGGDKLDPPSADERDTLALCTSEKEARLACQIYIRGDLALRPVES